MKLLVLSFLLLSLKANALDGKNLNQAIDAVFQEAAVEIELDSIEAWESTLAGNEIEVKILSHDHNTGVQTLLVYGCHLHGTTMTCHHEEGHGHEPFTLKPLTLTNSEFTEVKRAHQTAMTKLGKTLKRQNTNFSALISLKIWKLEQNNHNHSHEHGADVYIKAVYTLKGVEKTTYIQCHLHPGETDYTCHYKNKGKDEPELEADHDHDH